MLLKEYEGTLEGVMGKFRAVSVGFFGPFFPSFEELMMPLGD
jgi:hypothetical protein